MKKFPTYKMLITTRSKLHKVLLLALSVTFLFVCASYILGMAERICAKFTRKMCLVPRSDEFVCQGQRLRSQGTNVLCTPITPWQQWNGRR